MLRKHQWSSKQGKQNDAWQKQKQSLCQTTPWIGTKVAFILPDLYTQTMSPSPGIPGISDLSLPLNKLNIEKINSKKGELIWFLEIAWQNVRTKKFVLQHKIDSSGVVDANYLSFKRQIKEHMWTINIVAWLNTRGQQHDNISSCGVTDGLIDALWSNETKAEGSDPC